MYEMTFLTYLSLIVGLSSLILTWISWMFGRISSRRGSFLAPVCIAVCIALLNIMRSSRHPVSSVVNFFATFSVMTYL